MNRTSPAVHLYTDTSTSALIGRPRWFYMSNRSRERTSARSTRLTVFPHMDTESCPQRSIPGIMNSLLLHSFLWRCASVPESWANRRICMEARNVKCTQYDPKTLDIQGSTVSNIQLLILYFVLVSRMYAPTVTMQ